MTTYPSPQYFAEIEATLTTRYHERRSSPRTTAVHDEPLPAPPLPGSSRGNDGTVLPTTTMGTHVLNEELSNACATDNIKQIQALLAKGANVNAVGTSLTPPLHMAIQHQQHDVIELLLSKGADPALADKFGTTAIHLAAQASPPSVLMSLLNISPEHSRPTMDERFSPIHYAAAYGNTAAVKVLLDAGVDINIRAGCEETPLHVAVEHKQLACVRLLLEKGANLNASTKVGNTPLHRAARRGYFDVVWTLLVYDADVNLRSESGKTALDHARKAGHAGVAELLEHPQEVHQQ